MNGLKLGTSEVVPDDLKAPRKADTLRAGDFGQGFQIDFGCWQGPSTVKVQARIHMDDKDVLPFALAIAHAALDYTKNKKLDASLSDSSVSREDHDAAEVADVEGAHK